MRGRTLNDSFVILDEAQNTSPEQMKMFLTRLGFNSKMVITGDITQIDLPRDQRSGLVVVADILERRRGRRVRPLRRRGRRAPPPRAADRRGLRRARRARRAGAAPGRAPRRSPARRSSPCSRSRSSATAAPDAPPPAEVERLVALALASAGVEDGHVAVEFVARRADRRAQRGAPRQERSDRRAVVPDRRGGRRPRARASWATSSSAPSTPRTCARPSSTARCTSPAWTTRPTRARCSRCRRSS